MMSTVGNHSNQFNPNDPSVKLYYGNLGHDGPSKGEGNFGYDGFALTEIP